MRTIKSSSDFERVFSTGKRVKGRLFTTIIAATPEQRGPSGRVAFAAGKRLGSAVLRNRCKRVMRAGVQRLGGPWDGWDVLFVARRQVVQATPEKIDELMRSALERAGVIKP